MTKKQYEQQNQDMKVKIAELNTKLVNYATILSEVNNKTNQLEAKSSAQLIEMAKACITAVVKALKD